MSGDIIIRCSSIGHLMAKPENADLDPVHVTPEVMAIIAKTKRSEEEKSVLEEVRRKSLSAGGKTHVRKLVREAIYGYEPGEIETRPILKGRAVESDCRLAPWRRKISEMRVTTPVWFATSNR